MTVRRRPDAGRLVVALLAALGGLAALLVGPSSPPSTDVVLAADTMQFQPGNIISDQLFFDGNALSVGQVQTFLNAQNPNCKVSTSDGTWCLKDYLAATPTMAPTATCPGGYAGSPSETAAAVITKVGQACGISQKVLLVILQKEQGLVTGSGSSLYAFRYTAAMGYACPDTARCNPAYAGFFNQLYYAANQYKVYAAKPGNYATRAGIVNQIRYSPDASCGTSPVFVENQATAGLYAYTPYQPNAAALRAGTGTGDGCSAYGNRNFWNKFTDWFGSTQVPGAGEVTGRYAAMGGATGSLGAIKASVVCGLASGGCYQPYANGAIYWSPASGARVVTTGPLRDKWGSLGWEAGSLGYPVSDTVCGLARSGCYQGFQNGSMYWTAGTGAHVLSGPVRDKWTTTGLEGGYLGYPTTDVTSISGGAAAFAHFTGGSIYWSAATGARVMGGVVYDRWAAAGWERSSLGLPISDLAVAPDKVGLYQHFRNGSVYWTPSTGARLLTTAVRDAWRATGWESGTLGYPVTDVTTTPNGKAQYAHFQRGSIYSSTATGAHPISGTLYDAWAATGWENGALGLPVSGPGSTPDGQSKYQHFQGGSVYAATTYGTHVLPTVIRNAWAATGWERGSLGYPTSDVSLTPDGRGQVMTFQRGQVYVSAATGAHGVASPVLAVWKGVGGETGAFGLPVSDAGTTPDGKARYQHFEGGSIYSTAQTGAHALPTVLRNAWAASGYERGPLGYPTTDPGTTPDGVGRYVHFQGGSIYWTAATGAHVIRGAVRDAWAAQGWERGRLGYPTTDVTVPPDGRGAFAYFQAGAIYWSPATGAHALSGAVLDAWARTGWEQGSLGYPTSGPQAVAGGTRTTFQRGAITVATATGVATVTVN